MFITLTEDRFISHIDEMFTHATGFEGKEVVGRMIDDMIRFNHPECIASYYIDFLKSKKSMPTYMRIHYKTGRKVWYQVEIQYQEGGKKIYNQFQIVFVQPLAFPEPIDKFFLKLDYIEQKSGKESLHNFLKGLLEQEQKTMFEYLNSLLV